MKKFAATFVLVLIAITGMSALQATPAAALGAPAQDYVNKINDLRASLGLQPLVVDEELSNLGHLHDGEMAAAGRLFHAPDLSAGVSTPWVSLGENVGTGTVGSDLFQAFLDSPRHYGNIVNPAYTHVGIGTDIVDGKEWTTQRFLQIRVAAPVVAPAPRQIVTPAKPVAAPVVAPAVADPAPVVSAPVVDAATTAPGNVAVSSAPAGSAPFSAPVAGSSAVAPSSSSSSSIAPAAPSTTAPEASTEATSATPATDVAPATTAPEVGEVVESSAAPSTNVAVTEATVLAASAPAAPAGQPIAAPARNTNDLIATIAFSVAFVVAAGGLVLIAFELRSRSKDQAVAAA